MNTSDVRIAAFVVAAYFLLALVALPSSELPRALGCGFVVFASAAALGSWQGQGPFQGVQLLFVAFSAGAVLAMPTFPAMGGRSAAAIPIGFLGMQAATLLWAALRWVPRPPGSSMVSLRDAMKRACQAALALSVIATVPVVGLMLSRDSRSISVLLVYPGYFTGALAAALIYWMLQPIAHLATGRYFIGVLGGSCAFLALWPVAALLQHEPVLAPEALIIAFVAGGLVGPAITLGSNVVAAA